MGPEILILLDLSSRSLLFNLLDPFWYLSVIESTVLLTLKAPITTAADDIHKCFVHCFSEEIRLDVSSESSARQRIHMKN